MHIERDIRNSFWEVEIPIYKKFQGAVGVLICRLGHHSRTFPALRFLPAPLVFFSFFSLISVD